MSSSPLSAYPLHSRKIITLWVLSTIGLLLFALEAYFYLTQSYAPFVQSHTGWETYIPSAVRMVCRLGYVVAMVGLLLLRRWGAVLLIIVWLAQLVPAAIYGAIVENTISTGTLFSAGQLAFAAVILLWCRPILSGRIVLPLVGVFCALLALHTALYLYLSSAAGAVAA